MANNVHLHTIFESPNKLLTLVSVTPFWAVALKLVRYTKWDPGDICILLRCVCYVSFVSLFSISLLCCLLRAYTVFGRSEIFLKSDHPHPVALSIAITDGPFLILMSVVLAGTFPPFPPSSLAIALFFLIETQKWKVGI